MRKIIIVSITSAFLGSIIFGCYDEPEGINPLHFPNNGAYGPDATPYYPDAAIEADAYLETFNDASDASVDVSTSCINECATLQCGTISNHCGGFLTCTPCRASEECVDNLCRVKPPVCVSETDATFCGRFNAQCGSYVGLDNCGTQRTVANCGACAGVCQVNHSCCIPETDAAMCARLGKQCGTINATDNCGTMRVANCPACVAPLVCTINTCGP